MKRHYCYQCEFGHQWSYFRDETEDAVPGEEICPDGHEAIGMDEKIPADEIQITIEPAAFMDSKGKLFLERRYFFLIHERVGGDAHLKSRKTHLWREALNLADRFHGISKERAWKMWMALAL
ncbi:MAG: hypothetical protein IPJ30_21790 [Acidobacteria bacterium]|nr:hypothetical protein [Acidobacteriota bacterium]